MADSYLPGSDNPEFLNWLLGKNKGRGVPTWDRPGPGNKEGANGPVPGRAGGYPGWQRGMPLAPGTSQMPGGRMGGTYAPSGNMPMPPFGGAPAGVGNGIGAPQRALPPPLGGGAFGPGGGTVPVTGERPNLGRSIPGMPSSLPALTGLGALMAAIKSQPANAPYLAGGMGGTPVTPTGPLPPASQTLKPEPIPNAPGGAPPPAQPIPPAVAGMQPTPVGMPPAGMGGPPRPAPGPSQVSPAAPPQVTPAAPALGGIPMPQPRPAQPPMPMPRPRPGQPTPMPRPAPPQQSGMVAGRGSLPQAIQSNPQLASILKALLGSPMQRDRQTGADIRG